MKQLDRKGRSRQIVLAAVGMAALAGVLIGGNAGVAVFLVGLFLGVIVGILDWLAFAGYHTPVSRVPDGDDFLVSSGFLARHRALDLALIVLGSAFVVFFLLGIVAAVVAGGNPTIEMTGPAAVISVFVVFRIVQRARTSRATRSQRH